MTKRIALVILCLGILLIGLGGQPAYAASRLTKMVVGCRNFLVTGSTFVIRPTSEFSVLATDSAGHTVYSRIGNMPVGRYGGFSGLFSGQPAQGPVHIVITLNGATIGDLSAEFPAHALCGVFNARPDYDFTDGRLNVAEPWQPVAIYCYGNGTLSVLLPRFAGDENAIEVMRVTLRDLARHRYTTKTNSLVRSSHGIELYQLATGGLEIVAPTHEKDKPYTFIWGGC